MLRKLSVLAVCLFVSVAQAQSVEDRLAKLEADMNKVKVKVGIADTPIPSVAEVDEELAVTGWHTLHLGVPELLVGDKIPPYVTWTATKVDGTRIFQREGFNCAIRFPEAGRYLVSMTASEVDGTKSGKVYGVTVSSAGQTVTVSDYAQLQAEALRMGKDDTIVIKGTITVPKPLAYAGRLMGDPADGPDGLDYTGINQETNGTAKWTACALSPGKDSTLMNLRVVNKTLDPSVGANTKRDRELIAYAFNSADGVSVVNCSFGNWRTIMVNYSNRILFEGCSVDDDLRDYFFWNSGKYVCLYDCKATDSKHEHIARGGGYELWAISGCYFQNQDKRPAQPNNTAKGVLVMQKGKGAYSSNNTLLGPVGMGPLGRGDGVNDPDARLLYAVSHNDKSAEGFRLELWHGLSYFHVGGFVGGSIVGEADSEFAYAADRLTYKGLIDNFTGTFTPSAKFREVVRKP